MANINRGESSFESEQGTTFHLVIDFNALAEAEDAADMDVEALLDAITPKVNAAGKIVKKPRIKHLGALLYGALRRMHPAITLPDAIELLNEGEHVGMAIAKAMEGAMPKPDPSAVGKAPAKKRGTGTKP